MFSQEMWKELAAKVVTSLPQIASAVLVFLLFWLASVLARRIVIRVGTARGIKGNLTRFLGRVARVTLMLVGTVSALGTAGIDVAALVAGLGLTGFALGFALKDSVSNVLAGILVIVYEPFRQDDYIKVKSFEGKVVDIDLRYTVLDTGETRIFVPNSILFTDAITVSKPAS
jgi:small conductance mechanosensitive channel